MRVQTYTPPEVAQRYRVKPETVHGWIRAGELAAINVAARGRRRPRYRITADALAEFERRRAAVPQAKPAPRRRKPEGVTEFFDRHGNAVR